MLDLKSIRDDPQPARTALARRGRAEDLDRLLEVDREWREALTKTEQLRAEQNQLSKAIGQATPESRQELIQKAGELKADLEGNEARAEATKEELDRLLLDLPNLPDESAPDGESDDDNVEIKVVGDPRALADPKDHVELGQALGMLDLERAARLSGSRFAYLMGPAVWLELALVRYCLDRLATRGFVPVVPPVLVREEAMYGTGFFPTDQAQIYKTEEDDLYLVGTSEVSLAGLHQGEILDPESLPLRYAGFSTCFRREAGTYGKDTQGMFRVHQFDKVEMFTFVMPEASRETHDELVSIQEEIVQGLGLPYRLVNVCLGELGASAAKKIDLEVWLPGQGRYRELMSCSNTTDYQARRLECRVRTEAGNQPVHTLNGTACAVGRTIIALLENGQREDGSVVLPETLHAYLPENLRALSPG
ncbi:MAG: serine--tRNA ligase [Actinobacteria bacterium]|nr:serine--tRNA ligase [Actinomycetota bacterium]